MRLVILSGTLEWAEERPRDAVYLGWTKRPPFVPQEGYLVLELHVQVKLFFISKTWRVRLAYGLLDAGPMALLPAEVKEV